MSGLTDMSDENDHKHADLAYFAHVCAEHLLAREEILKGVDTENVSPEVEQRLEEWHAAVANCACFPDPADPSAWCRSVGIRDGLLCFLNQCYKMDMCDQAFWSRVHEIATKARLRSLKKEAK